MEKARNHSRIGPATQAIMLTEWVNRCLSRLQDYRHLKADTELFFAGVTSGVAVVVGAVTATITQSGAVIGVLVAGAAIVLAGYLVDGLPSFLEYVQNTDVTAPSNSNAAQTHSRSKCDVVGLVSDPRSGRTRSLRERKQILISADVATRADGEIHLTDTFTALWLSQIQTFQRDDRRAADQFASSLGVAAAMVEMSRHGEAGVIVTRDRPRNRDGEIIGWWASMEALSADLAITSALAECVPIWEELSGVERGAIVTTVRSFLETCPGCGREMNASGDLDTTNRADRAYVSVTCEECGGESLNPRE